MPIKGWVTPVEESGIVENFITRQNTSSDLQSRRLAFYGVTGRYAPHSFPALFFKNAIYLGLRPIASELTDHPRTDSVCDHKSV
jgi:hypothetical protein